MKKLISVLLCVAIALCIVPTVQAAEVAETKQTTVSLKLDPTLETYTLTIPATVSIDPSTKDGTIEISLTNMKFIWHSGISVLMSAANSSASEQGSYLVNSEDSNQKIHYNATSSYSGAKMHGDRSLVVLECDYDVSVTPEYTVKESVSLEVDGTYPGAGTYTDTLTFSVELS